MPRCQNWTRQNNAFTEANPPSHTRGKRVERAACAKCFLERDVALLRLEPAPLLGPRRKQIVCRSCA